MPTDAEVISRAIRENTDVLKNILEAIKPVPAEEKVPMHLPMLIGSLGAVADELTAIQDNPQLNIMQKSQAIRTLIGNVNKIKEQHIEELKLIESKVRANGGSGN